MSNQDSQQQPEPQQQQEEAPQQPETQQPEPPPKQLTAAEKEAEFQGFLKEIDQTIQRTQGSNNAKVQEGLAKLRGIREDLADEWRVAKRWGAVAKKVLQAYSLIKFVYDIFMS